MKTETRIERGTCRIAAAVAIAVLSAAGTLWAASLPTPRIVPVDPLLDEVDAATGRMTFYSVGEIGSAAEGFEVSSKRVRIWREQKFGIYSKAYTEGSDPF